MWIHVEYASCTSMPDRVLMTALRHSFEPGEDEVQVLVVVPTAEPARKRQKLAGEMTMYRLWRFSDLKPNELLPGVHNLKTFLQKPLPFKLRLSGSVPSDDLFTPEGPLVSCPKLEALLNYFIVVCGCDSPTTASENRYQPYYDVLFGITNFLCYARGFYLLMRRHSADTTPMAKNRLRPDYILQYNCLVRMRGEERSDLVKSYTAVEELTAKMHQWNVVLYGDLPYILGFATAADTLRVVAIERTDGPCRSKHLLDVNIFQNKAGALKLFYNLAFLLHHMDITTKHPYRCGLIPFEPDDDDKRTIVLLDGGIERTIKRSGYCIEGFERIVDIYTKLQVLSAEGSSTTHLQTVEELRTKEDGSLVVDLSPVGYHRRPKVDEVANWLRDMLTALRYWHGCGYCHGDIRWRNTVAVPTSGSSYWMLIDMDESHLDNTKTVEWNHQCKGSKLRFQHDLYQLGRLMIELAEIPDDMKEMQKMLLSTINEPGPTAEDALAHLAKKKIQGTQTLRRPLPVKRGYYWGRSLPYNDVLL